MNLSFPEQPRECQFAETMLISSRDVYKGTATEADKASKAATCSCRDRPPETRRGYLLFGREVKEVDEVGVSEDAEFLEAPSHTLLPRHGVARFTPHAIGVAGLPPHALADALGSEADGVRGRVTCHGTEEQPLALSPLVSH